jgi:hypothetical protein
VECATIELAENNGKPFYRLKQKGRLIDFID